jgi:hypothetical protein
VVRLVLCLLFLAACSLGSSYRIRDVDHPLATRVALELHADVRFRDAERDAIELAASRWEYFTNGIAHVHVEYDVDLRDVERDAEHDLILRVDSKAPVVGWLDDGALAFVVHDRENKDAAQKLFVVMDRIRDPGMLYRVMLHEIGHLLWLPNMPRGTRAIMSENVNGFVCPHRIDMERFCAFHQCNLEDVRWCE